MSRLENWVIAASLSALALTGCASTWQLTNGPETPAAQGKVVVKTGPNNNTRMSIVVKHLAPPQKVTPTGTVYVVWVRGPAEGDRAQNVGALKVDGNLTGEIDTLTPLRTFALSITVESGAGVSEPTGNPVLTAFIQRKQ